MITNAANSGAESAEHAEVIDGAQLGGKRGDSAWVNHSAPSVWNHACSGFGEQQEEQTAFSRDDIVARVAQLMGLLDQPQSVLTSVRTARDAFEAAAVHRLDA